jgi:pyruvate dehydrogenase E2 component (dihydrolipoamide acetyltransferase)
VTTEIIHVPDLGGAETVEVIELCVAPGDTIEIEQSLIVLESDKATMDVPSPKAGTVKTITVKEGDTVSEGSTILEVDVADGGEVSATDSPLEGNQDETASTTEAEQSVTTEAAEQDARPPESIGDASLPDSNTSDARATETVERIACVPDTGTSEPVEIIELSASPGDTLSEGDSLVVVETDKATMEIPVAFGGELIRLLVKEGDKVTSGDDLAVLAVVASSAGEPSPANVENTLGQPEPKDTVTVDSDSDNLVASDIAPVSSSKADSLVGTVDDGVSSLADNDVYAGPASRALARELGVDLRKVKGTGPRGRILKEDLNNYVKNAVSVAESGVKAQGAIVGGGSGIPPVPDVDFSKFGEVELVPLQKIHKLTAANMTRSWLNVPHVTQFDEADITDLEEFRRSLKAEAEKRGTRLTPLPFLLKACAHALVENPEFNRSITSDGETFVQKKYVHIGVAVDTPRGLVVPVIRDVDTKGLWQLAEEVNVMAAKARDGNLSPAEMQGGCFTISSLGAIGGNGFTPIVNAPEVGILGVSKSQMKPVWNGSEFVPRMMLPLSVSYDHRVVNGADCGRFFTFLVSVLSDTRRLAL